MTTDNEAGETATTRTVLFYCHSLLSRVKEVGSRRHEATEAELRMLDQTQRVLDGLLGNMNRRALRGGGGGR